MKNEHCPFRGNNELQILAIFETAEVSIDTRVTWCHVGLRMYTSEENEHSQVGFPFSLRVGF